MKRAALITSGALILALAGTSVAFAHGGPGRGGAEGVERMFETFDRDDDGKVTRAEIDALRAERFADADADGDGKLSAEEMQAFAAARQAERAAERRAGRIERMIERLDTDGDGLISADELADMGPERMFERLDADDDGAISREEAREARAGIRRHRGGDGHEGRGHGHGRHEGRGNGGGAPWWLQAD